MTSRRSFLMTLAAGAGAAAASRPFELFAAESPVADKIGLQLYSLREDLPKDVPGTLARVRELGIVEVEGAGLWGLTAEQLRSELDKAGLECRATHMGLDRLRDDLPGAIAEAKTMGASWVVCPWLPHEGDFDRDDVMAAAEVFNAAGPVIQKEGMQLGYHCHGYEFVPSAEGTLFDTLAQSTDAEMLKFEIDVFWARAGGVDPTALVERYAGRVPLLHLKDMQKGLELPLGSSSAPHETNVVIGTGQIDFPALLRAAEAGGGELYYIEDESPEPWEQLPGSLSYLRGLEL